MKSIRISNLCQLILATVLCQSAFSNLAAPMVEIEIALEKEAVEIGITGNTAEVKGVFTFSATRSWYDKSEYDLYLPVYAPPGADTAKIKPTISKDGKALAVEFIEKPPFDQISTVAGQQSYWFKAKVSDLTLKEFESRKNFALEIAYQQPLSQGVFIYTPLIPKQKKGVDYGSISLSADRGMKLRSAESHDFAEKQGKLVVEPHHTRSIMVELDPVIP